MFLLTQLNFFSHFNDFSYFKQTKTKKLTNNSYNKLFNIYIYIYLLLNLYEKNFAKIKLDIDIERFVFELAFHLKKNEKEVGRKNKKIISHNKSF